MNRSFSTCSDGSCRATDSWPAHNLAVKQAPSPGGPPPWPPQFRSPWKDGPVYKPAPLFEVRKVTKTYATPEGRLAVLNRATARFDRGLTAILGESGQGKTTLLRLFGGLERPDEGELLFDGQEVDFNNRRALRMHGAANMAWVFQDYNLIGHQRADANVALPLLCRGVPRTAALDEARQRLLSVNLKEEHFRRRPHELSQGQQQRVAIARAFAAGAKVILADEPTGSLDPKSARLVMRSFVHLSRREDTPVVMVTHDHHLAQKYADHVFLCAEGKLIRKRKKSQPSRINVAG